MSKYKPLEWYEDENCRQGDGHSNHDLYECYYAPINKYLSFEIRWDDNDNYINFEVFLTLNGNDQDKLTISYYDTLEEAQQACENYQFRELA